MMKSFLILSIILILGSSGMANDYNRFVMKIPGWELTELGVYEADSLYDYIDGGAEVYLAHNFCGLYAHRYEKPGQPEIVVDIFSMGSHDDAYGVYHHDMREGESAGIGTESELNENALFFHRNRYFVSIFAFDVTDETVETMLKMGREFDSRMRNIPNYYSYLHLLPKLDFQPVRLPKYFHHYQCLNQAFFVAEGNVFNLTLDCKAVLAEYAFAEDAENTRLLIIRYPEEKEAQTAYKNFTSTYMPDADDDNFIREENGTKTGAELEENYIFVIFYYPSSENDYGELMENIRSHIQKVRHRYERKR